MARRISLTTTPPRETNVTKQREGMLPRLCLLSHRAVGSRCTGCWNDPLLLGIPRIVGGIDVLDHKRAFAVYLHDCISGGPAKVLHPRRQPSESSSSEFAC